MTVEQKLLKDHVYEYLSDKITEGKLKPNEKIDIDSICEDLKVSRTPVREALVQLSNDRYLEAMPRRGFAVREVTKKEIEEIYAIMGCLEGFAASLAVSNISEDNLNEMDRLVEKMDDSLTNKKYRDYHKLQLKFHDVFVQASGNTELNRLIFLLKNRFMKQAYSMVGAAGVFHDVLLTANEQHKQIVSLFRKKNPYEIEKYLRDTHWSIEFAHLTPI